MPPRSWCVAKLDDTQRATLCHTHRPRRGFLVHPPMSCISALVPWYDSLVLSFDYFMCMPANFCAHTGHGQLNPAAKMQYAKLMTEAAANGAKQAAAAAAAAQAPSSAGSAAPAAHAK
jgi:hypothetical protein